MPSSSFTFFENFKERMAKGEFNLHTDTLKIYLSNATPSTSADDVKADLAEITAENGYTAGGVDTQNTVSETAGVASIIGVDVVITASGGTFGPFRYVVLYDDTHASDALVGWWDYASAITPNAPDTFTTDFGSSMFTLT